VSARHRRVRDAGAAVDGAGVWSRPGCRPGGDRLGADRIAWNGWPAAVIARTRHRVAQGQGPAAHIARALFRIRADGSGWCALWVFSSISCAASGQVCTNGVVLGHFGAGAAPRTADRGHAGDRIGFRAPLRLPSSCTLCVALPPSRCRGGTRRVGFHCRRFVPSWVITLGRTRELVAGDQRAQPMAWASARPPSRSQRHRGLRLRFIFSRAETVSRTLFARAGGAAGCTAIDIAAANP